MTVTAPVITATTVSARTTAITEADGMPGFANADRPAATYYRIASREEGRAPAGLTIFLHQPSAEPARDWNDRLRDLVRLYDEDDEDDVQINATSAARASRLLTYLDSAGYVVDDLNIFGDEDGYIELQFRDLTYTYTVTVAPEGPYEYRSVQLNGPNVVRYHVATDRTLAGLISLRVDQ